MDIHKLVFNKAYILFIACWMGFGSCRTSGVAITIKNDSNRDFTSFSAQILGKPFSFENFGQGQSRKIKVDKAYRYCLISAIMATDTLRLIPVDYVGEKLYTNGKLTMILTVGTNQNGHPRLELETYRRGIKLP